MEWLADVGGITRSVFVIGQLLIVPFATFSLKSFMALKLVRVIPS